jgi:magnesium transporter
MSGPEVETVRSALPAADLTLVEQALAGDPQRLKDVLLRVRPADLGRDLSRRSAAQVRQILKASEDRRAAAMLRAAHPAAAAKAVAACDPAHAGRLLGFIPTDHQVSILAALGPAARDAIEATFEPASKAQLDRLLAHPEAAVGRLMTPKIWRCERKATAGKALDILRTHAGDIEVAQNCYVVEAGRLVGVVALRELAIMPLGAAIDSVMTPEPIAVRDNASRADAAEIIQTHDFLSLPVVDVDGELLGAVRVDDLLDAALSKVGTGLLNQGAVQGKIAGALPYFLTPMSKVVRSRITWLILLFVAETATGTVLRHFESELAKVVALSFFIPLLIGTGGNAGSQTVSTLIRAMALGEVRAGDTLRVLLKEASTGLALGLLLGSIAFGRALMWGVGYDLAGCVALTVLIVCTWANTVGALIPLTAQRVGIDPTVVSGPLITTLVDASGLFIYLSVAHLMIAQLHG